MCAYLTMLQEVTEAPYERPFPSLGHQFSPNQRGLLVFPAISFAGGLQPFLP